LAAVKRLWPILFAEQVAQSLDETQVRRFVVSTHAMTLAHQMDNWLKAGGLVAAGWNEAVARYEPEASALPRALLRRHQATAALAEARLLPGLLDVASELADEAEAGHLRNIVRATLRGGDAGGRLETYYALLMMDGDRMGAWLSGGDAHAISYLESFHPQVRQGFEQHAQRQPMLQAYARQKRALSPHRHLAISGALNDFSLTVVRHVVESEFLGRLIYAGGDDVLAMLPVADVLGTMQRLRNAYSGHDPKQEDGQRDGLSLQHGFALLNGRLMRMMGTQATASTGAVIAHHQAPLGAVLRELRAAEKRAKNEGGRDAFSLSVVKRAGGTLRIVAKWGEPIRLLETLRRFLAEPDVSRRAVYHTLQWLRDLPDGQTGLWASLLAHQFTRQSGKAARTAHDVPALAAALSQLAGAQPEPRAWLADYLCVAEFLARETRAGA
jgi:CRISPR-associated protein Cmr2